MPRVLDAVLFAAHPEFLHHPPRGGVGGVAPRGDPAHPELVEGERQQGPADLGGVAPAREGRVKDVAEQTLAAPGRPGIVLAHDVDDVERAGADDGAVELDDGRVVEGVVHGPPPRGPERGRVDAGLQEPPVDVGALADLQQSVEVLLAEGSEQQSVGPAGPGHVRRGHRAWIAAVRRVPQPDIWPAVRADLATMAEDPPAAAPHGRKSSVLTANLAECLHVRSRSSNSTPPSSAGPGRWPARPDRRWSGWPGATPPSRSSAPP